MKQYNATVLAKGQVVIPKELRDDLWINVWDSMSCFIRWSAVILKKKLQTTSYKLSDSSWDQLPVWVDLDGKTLSVAIDELQWITCLLWMSWFGKSVHALNMMINMYTSWKSIIVFDPYGNWISEIKNYFADLSDRDLYSYTVWESTDRDVLKSEIKKDTKQKIVAINTNFQWIGAKKATEFTEWILSDCYNELMNDSTAVFLDEFWAYYNNQIRWQIISSPWYTCILDQWLDYLSRDQVKNLFKNIDNIAIYQVWWLTAKYLVEDVDISHTVQELRNIEKYHFYFHSNQNKGSWKLLLWIYPFN